MSFDDGPDLEFKKSARIYNKKLRALKEKQNIKDISNTDSHEKSEKTIDQALKYDICKIAVKKYVLNIKFK